MPLKTPSGVFLHFDLCCWTTRMRALCCKGGDSQSPTDGELRDFFLFISFILLDDVDERDREPGPGPSPLLLSFLCSPSRRAVEESRMRDRGREKRESLSLPPPNLPSLPTDRTLVSLPCAPLLLTCMTRHGPHSSPNIATKTHAPQPCPEILDPKNSRCFSHYLSIKI